MDAQRRPGRQPQRHRIRQVEAVHAQAALNEGRGVSPSDTCELPPSPHRMEPLNEGRGVSPSDTQGLDQRQPPALGAQRRPGRQPQRHLFAFRIAAASWTRRSTKAGASAPATPFDPRRVPYHAGRAQRRPGRQPQRHPRVRPAEEVRLTVALNEGRGVSPSDTPGGPPRAGPRCPSLNEGRGVSPSDTREKRDQGGGWAVIAQRRPGRQPQRHRTVPLLSSRDAAFAQRRPGRQPQRHMMKQVEKTGVGYDAQRRPGRQPQRHSRCRTRRSGIRRSAQRRPGRQPQRHPRDPVRVEGPGLAQRRPGRQPQRHVEPAAVSSIIARTAQRRPGRQPQRHPRWCCSRRPGRGEALNEGRGVSPSDTAKCCRRTETAEDVALLEVWEAEKPGCGWHMAVSSG